MALYTPPDKSSPQPRRSEVEEDKEGDTQDDFKKFYVRPSLGLRMWGPLVPASDNRIGLWTLVGIQTAVGAFFLHRIRVFRASLKVVKKDISDFPSLNRFSTTHGEMFLNPAKGGASSFFKSSSTNGGIGIARIGKLFNSPRWSTFKNVVYLLAGTLLLSQSLLETSRLTVLKYDPWCEEARSVRDKKFYNDIIQFYHEGVDPTKVKVKDATNGKVMSTNIPEVKQSVALVRAQAEAENLVIKWFGPLEYKPMSFTEFLDRLQYHFDIYDFLQSKRTLKENAAQLSSQISHSPSELEEYVRYNEEARQRIKDLVDNVPSGSIPVSPQTRDLPLRGVVLDADQQDADNIDFEEIWSLYDPWMNLALDTSLSIKFLPTVMAPENLAQANQNEKKDETEREAE
ncbi:MGR1 (YCL044C) [Zygosaccharomyces parabailii]|nr:MGR1 (YCL044C) [Zygosaccharomyces parabailii]CDH13291.1 related to Mitochondrial inner membrane i-AAA protease complex subunit MGR1 [Zygosaccharomyces bailii ISA1307]